MSPRTSEQFAAIREQKTALIMETALELFAHNGYFSTTISDIAKKAGISKGLLYNYFESKEALLRAIIQKSVNEVYQYLDLDHDGNLTGSEFTYFIRRLDELLKAKRYFWQLFSQLLMQKDVREELIRAYSSAGPHNLIAGRHSPDQVRKMFTTYFATRLQNGKTVEPEVMLGLFRTVLVGYVVTSVYEDHPDPNREKMLEYIIDYFK